MSTTWVHAGDGGDDAYTDIRYETSASPQGIAKITIARPDVRNAFRPRTVVEISRALERAREDTAIGVIVLTGEGTEAYFKMTISAILMPPFITRFCGT